MGCVLSWQPPKDAVQEDGAADDPLRYGPRPEDLVPRSGAAGAADGGADGVYRPPKLNPAAMQVRSASLLLIVKSVRSG